MVTSMPGSPEPTTKIIQPLTPQAPSALETPPKQRPQSNLYRPVRSQSRVSQSSKVALNRAGEEDGKTAVKVVVRVRPPLGPDDPGYDLIPQRFQRSTVQVTTPTSLGVDSPQGRKLFVFDRVFGEESTQEGIWDYLHDSVDSFLQGFNVSILAYGQSGSGKSYTMGTAGPTEQKDQTLKGVVPRAAQHLFDTLQPNSVAHSRQNSGLRSPTRFSVSSMNQLLANKSTPGKGWELSVTYVEIYNEQPRDLLLPEATLPADRPAVLIREDPKGNIFVEGLKTVSVNSIEELMSVLNHGSAIRQTDATAINARSSRSHAVFTINLKQTKATNNVSPTKDKRTSTTVEALPSFESTVITESKLHLVDLAGSERLKNTGATGDRAREGISINAGLASLGKVISQLSSRSSSTHVSYRDSKLTRMLQDSLGGNAITYMIACVTPAEFHLSETLNTIQYAQRARNIQSKPKIQQIHDDADKQAVIDRLRTEVAFLRQQIRGPDGGDRRSAAILERTDKSNDREAELHNQLLDVQESYSTLSQRHAKLVAELTKNSEPMDESDSITNATADNAIDRLKRSQANQQMIEQMVMEYEKTIQSLENNLSTTRSSLAATESNLLEKETKCAYIETVNQQLNTRVQKMIDREANTEQYLQDLEGRLEDKSSGDEKNDSVISDLRKEISRIRETETNAEDYISTLEERLAESDQDLEIMQREIERLEHLVERQRSLGKLDNLLYELGNIQRQDSKSSQVGEARNSMNGIAHEQENNTALNEAKETELPDDSDDLEKSPQDEADLNDLEDFARDDAFHLEALQRASFILQPPRSKSVVEAADPSPAQSKFVAEKFEAVSQELFDLRLEHESTVNELDLMSAKYQEALRTLAEMQDSFDEARHGPTNNAAGSDSRPRSFLEGLRVNEVRNGGQGASSSRSLSSELSLAGESAASVDTDITPVSKQPVVDETDVNKLHALLVEHQRGIHEANSKYAALQAEHKDALSTVERLKTEVSYRPASPSAVPGMIRRMTSQTNGVDRGQRAITALRGLVAEEFDGKPDRLESAEIHLTAVNHELQNRMERIQTLDAEVKNAKKDMEMKSTLISGLTRERNSMKAGSPVDLSMVSQMRDQLIQKETELKSLHEGYARREQELQTEIQSLSGDRSRQPSPTMPGNFENHTEKMKSLEERLNEVRDEHVKATSSLEEETRQHHATKAQLEAALANVTAMAAQTSARSASNAADRSVDPAMQQDLQKHQELVNNLRKEVEDQRALASSHQEKITELASLHETVTTDALALSDKIQAREAQLAALRAQIAGHEAEIKEVRSGGDFQKNALKALHESHANEIEEMKLSHAGVLATYDDQIAELMRKHDKEIAAAKQAQAKNVRSSSSMDNLVIAAQGVFGHPTSKDMLINHIQDMAEEKQHILDHNSRLAGANKELERQLTGRQTMQELEEELAHSNTKMANYQDTIRNLANEVGNHEETIREKEKAVKKHEAAIAALEEERKKTNIMIEDLEQQLQNSFDSHHNRVSVIQAQGNQALAEAQQRIASLEHEVDQRRSFQDSTDSSRAATLKAITRPQSPPTDPGQRSNSASNNLRKSASIASLPSPPPAIPLPPLPTLPGLGVGPTNNPSPPQSRHTSKEVSLPLTPNSANSNLNGSVAASAANSAAMRRQSILFEEQENRLRTIEKHLHAEKQLTATLEEALVDLETQSNKLRADAEGWKKKAWGMEEELSGLRKEKKSERLSVQAVEEEVKKRREAEAARAQLEERMRMLTMSSDGKKKKKGGGLNCF